MRTKSFVIAGIILSLGLASSHNSSMRASSVSDASAPTSIVLGSKSFAGKDGIGFGMSQPNEIFNGGDPAGRVTNIRWQNWGSPMASGIGETSIFKPNGGYYDQKVKAELRASNLGRCTTAGPLAYTRLEVREPSRPGGPLGKWFVWSDQKNLCKPIGS